MGQGLVSKAEVSGRQAGGHQITGERDDSPLHEAGEVPREGPEEYDAPRCGVWGVGCLRSDSFFHFDVLVTYDVDPSAESTVGSCILALGFGLLVNPEAEDTAPQHPKLQDPYTP